ncbi:MAG: hypothetical protein PVI82_02320 [Desulfobacterales bacterium]|jgi:cytosine deaminase
MKTNSLFIINARLPDGTQADSGVSDGLITGVFPAASAVIDKSSSLLHASGALVLPNFFDGHNHTDKTFMGVPWVSHEAGPDRTDRIETKKNIEQELNFSTEQRAGNLTKKCLEQGTTEMRCHIDVDQEIRLKRLEGMLAVREKYEDRISIEIVAFPQSGVVRSHSTIALLDEAIQM